MDLKLSIIAGEEKIAGFRSMLRRRFGYSDSQYDDLKSGNEIIHPVAEIVVDNWIHNAIARHESSQRRRIIIERKS